MTGVLVIVGVIVIVAGCVGLFMGLERASLRRLEHRREAWRAGGCVGRSRSAARCVRSTVNGHAGRTSPTPGGDAALVALQAAAEVDAARAAKGFAAVNQRLDERPLATSAIS